MNVVAELPRYTMSNADVAISSISDINDNGTIIGFSSVTDSNGVKSLYVGTPNATGEGYSLDIVNDISPDPRYKYSNINHLNNNDQFIIDGFDLKYANNSNRPNSAFFHSFAIVSKSQTGWAVNRLIPDENESSLYRVTGLNKAGQIIGDHILTNDTSANRVAFVASPIETGYLYTNLGTHPDFPNENFSSAIRQSEQGEVFGVTMTGIPPNDTGHVFSAIRTGNGWEKQALDANFPTHITSNRFFKLTENNLFELFKTNGQWVISNEPAIVFPSNHRVTDINDSLQAIGSKTLANNQVDYWFFSNQTFYTLSELVSDNSLIGWSTLVPKAINNKGQIVGIGNYNGQQLGFVLSPNNNEALIVIDGDDTDWSEIQVYQDLTGENTAPVDIETLQITGDTNNVYIAYHERQTIHPDSVWARQLLIDTDENSTTGFRYYDFNMGGDYLLLGNSLYKYSGNGETWDWTFIRSAQANFNGNFAEIAINRSDIGNSNRFRLTFYGANSYVNGSADDFLNVIVLDLFRGASEVVIDGKNNDWPDAEATLDQPNENTSPVDYQKVWFKHDSQYAYFAYQNRENIDVTKYWAWLILIDTDTSASGYQYDSIGGDFLILGDQLYKYAGTGNDWNWTLIKKVDGMVRQGFAEIAIKKSDLANSNNFKLVFYGSNTYAGGVVDDSVHLY